MPSGATGWQEVCSVSRLFLQWAWFLHACVPRRLWVPAEKLKTIWGSQDFGVPAGVVLLQYKSVGHWQEEQEQQEQVQQVWKQGIPDVWWLRQE